MPRKTPQKCIALQDDAYNGLLSYKLKISKEQEHQLSFSDAINDLLSKIDSNEVPA